MKKIISVLLIITLLMGCIFVLAACSDKKSSSSKKKDKAPEIPEGYKRYQNDDLSFAYPEDWTKRSGSAEILVNPEGAGNNITVVYEDKTDIYDDLTVESFNRKLRPSYEAIGMTLSNVAVKEGKTNNVEYVQISYNARRNGMSMKQTQLITSIGDYTYSITITEVDSDRELVETVIETLYDKN